MTLGLYEERARRRRNRRWAFMRWVFLFGAIGAVAVFAYESGRSLAEAEATALREEMDKVHALLDEAQTSQARLEAQLAVAEQARAVAEQRFREEVPRGPSGRIFDVIQEKLDSGVAEERLLGMLEPVERERACDDESVTKRFIVTTPLSGRENAEVRFLDSTLVVSAAGDSTLSAEGRPEAWFDTAKPVTVRFQVEGGEATEATGVLPVERSIILGDREHMFTVAQGARGFVEVTRRSCAYP